MDVLSQKTSDALLASLIAELAKATNEIKCAQNDLAKAKGRLQFAIAVTNELLNRKGD